MSPARKLFASRAAAGALAPLALTLCALAVTAGSPAQAHETRASASAASSQPSGGTCLIHSLPDFTAQGQEAVNATVADVVEVECDPAIYGTGSRLRITAYQLASRCQQNLVWYVPNPYRAEGGSGVTLELDADGNATVALRAGPDCQAGESLITAHMEESPYESFTTSYTVLPPAPTPPGVFALPSTQVEDAESSGVATIVQAEFGGGSEKHVHIASEELFHRCRIAPHLHWVLMDGAVEDETPEVKGVELDDDGNAFVIAIGDRSCAPGASLVEADLESKPFTTHETEFTILPPQPTAEPAFTIEKRQQIAGGSAGFTTAPLTGTLGETVDYEIVVTNDGRVPETFSGFIDEHCDPGTIAGGPGEVPVQPGQASTYTCSHVLTTTNAYENEATVTGATVDGLPLTLTSNRVVVDVAQLAIEKLQRIEGSGVFTREKLTGSVGQAVEYEIRVSNTGSAPLTLSPLEDPKCDPGTLAGGPGEAPLEPGASSTYTCSHVLSAAGPWVNTATLTATPAGGTAFPSTSNEVEANAEISFGPPAIVLKPPTEAPKPPTPGGGVLACKAPSPPLNGVTGPKRGTFTVQVRSAGIKRITFYLDGRKLETLSASRARNGRFTVRIDPRKLSYGAHKLKFKTVMLESACRPVARSATFVHPHPEQRVLHFTG